MAQRITTIRKSDRRKTNPTSSSSVPNSLPRWISPSNRFKESIMVSHCTISRVNEMRYWRASAEDAPLDLRPSPPHFLLP